jgi:hypothetical protein
MRWFLPLFLCLAGLTVANAQEVDALEWLDDYQEAVQLAKRTGKPIFLEYRCEP